MKLVYPAIFTPFDEGTSFPAASMALEAPAGSFAHLLVLDVVQDSLQERSEVRK